MANVLFTRTSDPNSKPVTDGQLIFDTSGNGKMYLDNGTNRLEMGGALTVDATLSKTSTNPVQNKAVAGVMLDTLSDIGNVTSKGFLTDALAVKELNTNVNELNNSIGDISGFTNNTYDSIGAYIQYCIDNAYLPDVNCLPLIPTMTSDTTPSGECSASSANTNSNHITYHAFDNNDSTFWSSAESSIPAWIKYKFPNKVCVRKAKIKPFKDNGGTHCKDFVIQGSNNDSNWTDLYSGTNPKGSTADIVVNFANNNKYQYYRCYMPNSYTNYCALTSLQLYGY